MILSFLGTVILYIDKILIFLILGAFIWAVTVVYYKIFLRDMKPVIANIIQFLVGSAFLFSYSICIRWDDL